MRTSQTHPIVIAEIKPHPNYGKIGITLCPGKVQSNSLSGPWSRSLNLDLDAIERWAASTVVSLIEDHELKALKVERIGQEVRNRHMQWLHLPIADGSAPDANFEQTWREVGQGLRDRLRCGANVLIHCKGGLGRAGTISARLLVELGWLPDDAIAAVRKVRPGAIETRAQVRHVMRAGVVAEPQPLSSEFAIRDRAIGAVLGLAVGDAIGTTLEFETRDTYPHLTDMIGGGPFRLQPGEWTDDTSMALALIDSLIENPKLDESDLMRRFFSWYDGGKYSVRDRCFDIGVTTRQALCLWEKTGNPIAGATTPNAAGNGSLMRLAPVAVRHWNNRDMLYDVAARQSRTTHGATEAVDACIAFADLLAKAIAGQPRSKLLAGRETVYAPTVAAIIAGSWRRKRRHEVCSTGYVLHALEAALWCVARSSSFAQAVLLAANLGEDADTTAAITGQLAGAVYGASGIPRQWLDRLAWQELITARTEALFADSLLSFGREAA